jgi:hypothetical protein
VQAVFYAGDAPAVLEEKPLATPRFSKSLPASVPVAANPSPPAARPAPAGRPLSPVRRAYAKPSAGSYPDTTESGCMTGIIVTGMFVIAFVVGLAMRHSKEMDGNLMEDLKDKVFGSMPKIKIERKEE